MTMAEGRQAILARANATLGEDNQVDHLIEEMAELTKALMKARRYGHDYRTHPVIEEVADVLICIETLKIILQKDLMKEGGVKALLSEEIDRKMTRLMKRLEAGQE